MRLFALSFVSVLVLASAARAQPGKGNRLAYLDELDPYYPSRTFPKLITPQWVGEPGVEAVVILAIDDMRQPKQYETFLRPILRRLEQIDGRAPVSIMTCSVDPKDPQLQSWLKEGLSLEVHTVDHPCPFFKAGFEKAKGTYDRCVDLLHEIPNSKPVAYRMPCCDSLNTPSPRFWAEIFNKTTAKGNYLSIDSSVFNVFTANDPALPRELVLNRDGTERFRRYLPMDRSFVNTIEDYAYPYVIGRLCWEFPCVTPSDWEAQHQQKSNNPRTVEDWKAALDCTVIKQGVFCLVFHPHGWIRNDQVVELIDHAVKKHGKKVKFLNFREAHERLSKHLLDGQTIRHPKTGGFQHIVLGDWGRFGYQGVQFIKGNQDVKKVWPGNGKWVTSLSSHVPWNAGPSFESYTFQRTIRLGDKLALVVGNDKENGVYSGGEAVLCPFKLPPGARLGDEGRDHGLRFLDLDGDGFDDVIFSNEKEYGIYLFKDMKSGWSRKVMAGKRGDPGALPMISRNGTNNGFFAHSRSLWWSNEDTVLLKDHVDRRSFNDLLKDVEPQALSPEASLRATKARPGFQVELMAAEPLVQDPIAFAWGPDGKLWVLEMGDYPLGVDGKGKPGGKVKFLEDTKGTGKYDKVTVFLDNLPFPTGVLPWGKGVLVTCAPDIFYAEDTDGDGKADKKVVLYTGFVEGNQQHRVNSLVWGLDGWIYCANGDSGGKVKSLKTGQVVDIRGRDLRIKPDTGEIETESGQTQYGRSRDDWGNWFGNNNSNPMYHYVFMDHYLRRNPHLPAPNPRVPVSVTPGVAPVYPISRTLPRFNSPEAANRFTSACSAIVYRDELFGPAFANNTFVSEPVHNLVHREVMTAKGVTFTSRRAADEQTSEFLASSDNWFRPTMIQTGPDGALWVADMYRYVIEHPQWIPKEWQAKLDLRAGHDKGRIYRVYPVGKTPRPIPRLDKLDVAGLVAALDSPSGWQRDMAQMLLVRRANLSAGPLLERLLRDAERPLTRLSALCTLDGVGGLTPEAVQRGMKDRHPGVRRHAVRLSERLLKRYADVGPAVLKLVDDPDPQVRMQVAYSLGEWDDARAGQALGRLALDAAGDPYLQTAVLSSVNAKNLEPILLAVLARSKKNGPPASLVENLMRMATAQGNTRATITLLDAVAKPDQGRYAPWQFATLAGLLDVLDQRNSSLAAMAKTASPEMQAALKRVTALFETARARAADPKAAKTDRRLAIRLLGRGVSHRQDDRQQLASLLTPQTPDELQTAAAASLGRLRDAGVPDTLLHGWKAYGPAMRGQVLDVLLGRPEWVTAVLDAIERKQVLPFEVDAARRQRLLDAKAAGVRQRAAKLFAGAVNPDRQKVVAAYRPALALRGDAAHGAKVFARTCATCHQLGGIGQQVGPDLGSLADKSGEALLTAVLDPNAAVEVRYVSYTATTKNGLTFSGLLASESGNSVTLVGPDGKTHVILRSDLDELFSSGKSVMPEGLEKDLSQQDLADLFAFLRASTPAQDRKVFEGNRPEVVHPEEDGSLRLLAGNCAIYGKTLALEKQYGNLGLWSSPDDRAVWTVRVPKAGKYAVWLDWACADNSAGNTFVLEAGAERLTGKVPGTGTWDTYRYERVGHLTLAAGEQQITFRAAGPIRGALIDLKAVKLIPQR
jgi:putative membrane-bound dehydrogenase-like protein